jgi:hypothetical protein
MVGDAPISTITMVVWVQSLNHGQQARSLQFSTSTQLANNWF